MDTVEIPRSEYKHLVQENEQLKKEVKYLQDGTIERLMKKSLSMQNFTRKKFQGI